MIKPIAANTRAAIGRALGQWYQSNRRVLPWRRTSDPYAIWVSEVMLQQTQVKTAISYYQRFMAQFPSVAVLAHADQQAVLKAWEGLGYYSRARNLHRAAQMVTHQMGGCLPTTWDDIRQLPGIGDYMAAAILSIAFGRPYAVVDGNVKRVVARLFCLETAVNIASGHKLFQNIAQQLLDVAAPGDHNQAMMELGALVCTPQKPLCPGCPVARYCRALKNKVVPHYPMRRKRAPIKEVGLVAGVVIKKGRILLVQRPEQGLLGGLWEFPNGEFAAGEAPVAACARVVRSAIQIEVNVLDQIAGIRHAYTHFKIEMSVFRCRWQSGRVRLDGPCAFRWVLPGALAQFPLHGAVQKILPHLGKLL
jgi:A/G-specific adenine glycosylase